ncbi:hypothetical protein [Paraburkholderia youngii]|uniref:Uncharacterized protein n=1 Tax=Paraburkholderia youngii TaxID=2782701 RepID=A0A7Y6K4Z7_9BURK|nr:hypothetical protein [Paraburkholderia youngii]NUY04011.1 hypothetical protein [Paraburkholderia youngii]
MSPVPGAGSAGCASALLCCDFAAAPVGLELVDFSVADVFASVENGVELRVLWIVMMDLAKARIARVSVERREPSSEAAGLVRRAARLAAERIIAPRRRR